MEDKVITIGDGSIGKRAALSSMLTVAMALSGEKRIEGLADDEVKELNRLSMPFTYYEPRTSVKVKAPLSKAQSKARKAYKNARKARKKNR